MAIPDIDYKIWLALLGITLEGINIAVYLFKTYKGVFKPHLFSWLIWALLNGIVFAAQLSKDAGPGTWQTGFACLCLTIVTIVALFKGDRNFKPSDWVALIFSLLAIPLWVATKEPLWSVILVSIIDIVITWPTARKSWAKPHQESIGVFLIGGIITSLGLISLEVFTVTTVLYGATIVILDLALCVMILARRRSIPSEAT